MKKETENAVVVKNVSKSFKVPQEKHGSLRAVVLNIFRRNRYSIHDAAKNISFNVKKGEFLGIVGRNGSGKSTMLKMLAKIYQPDSGEIIINGRLSPFLELGVGFNPELTARENIFLNGAILGLSKKEIEEKFDEIIKFAELEDFVDQKLKNFSSGMQVRLAFSVAIQAHAEILLIDEVLAVGDANFQAKCNKVFYRLKKEGKTIVFVTHNMKAVEEFCDRVILIKDAKIYKDGNPKVMANEYEKINLSTSEDKENDSDSWGSRDVVVDSLVVSTNKKTSNQYIEYMQPFSIDFNLKNNKNKKLLINLSVEIFKENGVKCFGTKTTITHKKDIYIDENADKNIKIFFDNNSLVQGEYYIDYRLFAKSTEDVYEAKSYALKMSIVGDEKIGGVTNLGYRWD